MQSENQLISGVRTGPCRDELNQEFVTLFGQGSSGESCELITIAVDMLGVVRKSENVLPRMNLCFTGDQLIGNVFFTV